MSKILKESGEQICYDFTWRSKLNVVNISGITI